ncbi:MULTISPECIES: DMT family transporter [unclassified Luteococcus]|uniref:DMT family transporter n=1 Tax=unclassified Luteococcus TaxID=2639923 RepID=UPI00313B3C9D
MHWIILVLSGLFEAVWATALDRISGLSRPVPIVVFLAAMAISMAGLAFGMREIPVGTAYAVWVGIGATATVAWAMLTGNEPVSVVKLLLVGGIVGCVIGLKLVSGVDAH